MLSVGTEQACPWNSTGTLIVLCTSTSSLHMHQIDTGRSLFPLSGLRANSHFCTEYCLIDSLSKTAGLDKRFRLGPRCPCQESVSHGLSATNALN